MHAIFNFASQRARISPRRGEDLLLFLCVLRHHGFLASFEIVGQSFTLHLSSLSRRLMRNEFALNTIIAASNGCTACLTDRAIREVKVTLHLISLVFFADALVILIDGQI